MRLTTRFFAPLLVGFGLVLALSGVLEGHGVHTVAVGHGPCWARIDGSSSDYPTVQAAVDAADEGALVKVAGYCAEVGERAGMTQTVYVSKSISMRGGYTISNWMIPNQTAYPTVLDAEGRGRVLTIVGPGSGAGETLSVTVEGLEIINGDANGLGGGWPRKDAGGGIYLRNAQAKVSDSRVSHNAARQGGGLYVHDSASLSMTESVVFSNTSTEDGGGIALDGSSALIARSTVEGNHAARWGGGLSLHGSDHVSIIESAVISNTAAEDGGGIHINRGNALVKRALIKHNAADDDGGGVYGYRTQATRISSSELVANSAKDRGGAVHLFEVPDGGLTLVNGVLAANAAYKGSGVYLDNASSDLIHTTIARNGGQNGVYLVGHSTLALTNTILASHTVGIEVREGSTATLAAMLLGSGPWANQEDWRVEGGLVTDSHTYQGAPAFQAPEVGDYGIGPDSEAVDKGLSTRVSRDIDGDPRPMGPAPDLGADEIWQAYLPLLLRVRAGGS